MRCVDELASKGTAGRNSNRVSLGSVPRRGGLVELTGCEFSGPLSLFSILTHFGQRVRRVLTSEQVQHSPDSWCEIYEKPYIVDQGVFA
jgi:hypothetical protein